LFRISIIDTKKYNVINYINKNEINIKINEEKKPMKQNGNK